MGDSHEQALRAAAAEYRRATEEAKQARDALAAEIRAAYDDDVRQSTILRAIDHVWTREYLRQVLGLTRSKDDDQPTPG